MAWCGLLKTFCWLRDAIVHVRYSYCWRFTLALCHMYLCVDHYWGQVIYILLPNTKNSQMLWPTANTPYQSASSHCATKSIASLSNWQLNGLKASKPQRRKSSITNFTSDSANIMSGHVVGQHGYYALTIVSLPPYNTLARFTAKPLQLSS
jgi:hypothetical protein